METPAPYTVKPLTPARGGSIMPTGEPLPAWFTAYLEMRYNALQQQYRALQQERAYLLKMLGREHKICPQCGGK